MELSPQQATCFDHYLAGDNVFLTGPGGSGKTALIRLMYEHANRHGRVMQVCALTGCAAVLLECNAKTIHSWSGVGLCSGHAQEVIENALKRRVTRKAWLEVQTLIVDETSMMSRKLFGVLDAIGKRARRNQRPFGGIQLIFAGDFFQLPPVADVIEFCFESPTWKVAFPYTVQLRRIFRQNDEVYVNILNHIRKGVLKRSMNAILMGRVGKTPPSDVTEPTRLFPLRAQADAINSTKLDALGGELVETSVRREYNLPPRTPAEATTIAQATYSDALVEKELMHLEARFPGEDTLGLRVGAQVMCIVNKPLVGLVNGSQGTVESFQGGLPVVDFGGALGALTMSRHLWRSEAVPTVGVSQLPLILSWALTIHKSQGVTLERAVIDAGQNIFECGQTYVALSRVRSLDGLYLTAFDAAGIKINSKVQEFYAALDAAEAAGEKM